MGRRSLLVEDVAGRIQQHIVKNGLSAGDRLPSEAALLEEHNVSRSVLREAINRLQPFGIVDVMHGKGMFVGDQNNLENCTQFVRTALAISPRNLTQFGELRTVLECWASRRAAEVATSQDVADLDKILDMLADTSRPYEETIALDFQFHQRIFEIAANPLMLSILTVLQQFVVEGMLQTTLLPRDHEITRKLHRAIVAAIRKQDPDAAEEAMKQHMELHCDRLANHADENVKAS